METEYDDGCTHSSKGYQGSGLTYTNCQEFFMREMEKQKNYTICTQLTPSWVKFKLGLVQNLLYREVNLRAGIIQKGLNPLHTQ